MTKPKDDPSLIRFMTLFAKLRGLISNKPEGLDVLAANDPVLKKLCLDIDMEAMFITMNERRYRELFTAPVDPKFVAAWRDYEARYALLLSGIFLTDLGLDTSDVSISKGNEFDIRWENADHDAKTQARVIEESLAFAEEQVSQEFRDFPDNFKTSIEDGVEAWKSLCDNTGFDLRGIFRRRELVPFVLIPRHVSNVHGHPEKLSLFTHLKQAHEAYIYGVPFAAIALMRSVMEVMLKEHYHSFGNDLEKMIDNCKDLPKGVTVGALHRLRKLANDVLHLNDKERIPKDMEKELLGLFFVLRSLIEGAPSLR